MDQRELRDLIVSTSLYKFLDFEPESTAYALAQRIYSYTGHVDCFCKDCGLDSVFRRVSLSEEYHNNMHDIQKTRQCLEHTATEGTLRRWRATFTVSFFCGRNERHRLIFLFRVQDDQLTKIGQFPSLADLAISEMQEYRKALEQQDYFEFNRAIGLAAYGVGIGALVYLRRILERLVEKAHQKALKKGDIDKVAYDNARFAGRISMCAEFLPDLLTKNKNLYGVLSKDLHELSEDECCEHFPTLRTVIELILDEEIAARKKEGKIAQAQKNLGKITGAVNKTKGQSPSSGANE